ncbi:MAG: YkgJ family cysteine cluster protein [Bacteroidetes bacterium]|nr:YkgJ family cysteine cluster protein [Bacteroidota bacterium]
MAEINIQKYTRRASRKKKELGRFLVRLGKKPFKGLLKQVNIAEKETWKEINCMECANCCKKMTPTYNRKDILRIAKHFKMTYKQFFDKWLIIDKNKDIINQSIPCQFLGKDNLCTIYDIRPLDCADFPHFNRRDFRYQAAEKTYTQNMVYCPATLVLVEKLKEQIEADL